MQKTHNLVNENHSHLDQALYGFTVGFTTKGLPY